MNSNGFKFVIFLYIICETLISKQEEFAKLHVNVRDKILKILLPVYRDHRRLG